MNDVFKVIRDDVKGTLKKLEGRNLSENEKLSADNLARLLVVGTLMSDKDLAAAVKESKKQKAA